MSFVDLIQQSWKETNLRVTSAIRCARGCALPLAIAAVAATTQAAIITVTGTGDTIAIDNVVTLREAITSANNNANINADVSASGTYGIDTINFNIAGAGMKTINLTSALPMITGPVTIDGYTQGVATANTLANGDNAVLLIELNGAGAGAGTAGVGIAGLTLGAGSGSSFIRGLVIHRFSGDGILVKSNANTITGNFIGTNPAGTAGGTGLGNANTTFNLVSPFRAGIFVDNASSHVARDPQRGQLPLQSKPKPARFVDRVNLRALFLLELGCPAQKRFLPESLGRLRIAPSLLANHDVKLLVHINSKLDHRLARIKLRAGSLV